MSDRRCISFPNQNGQLLHGIVHEPIPSTARGVCILLLSPGIKGRVGPHRLYLKIAARMVPLGFHVLRFDYYGLGDSEGELSERMLADIYNSIQAGRYIGDTIAAMDWIQKTFGIRRFVGSGLCGGSISALATAEVDMRIDSLLGIGMPTVLEGGPENWAKILTKQEAISLRGSYFGKVIDLKSMVRFISGQSNYQVIWRVVKQWLLERRSSAGDMASVSTSEIDHTNPRFANAFMAMLKSARPMMLLFSGADRLRYQFAENFENHYEARIRQYRHLYQVHLIQNANHVLSEATWVTELLDVAERWLIEVYRHR